MFILVHNILPILTIQLLCISSKVIVVVARKVLRRRGALSRQCLLCSGYVNFLLKLSHTSLTSE